MSMTSTPLVRRIRFPEQGLFFKTHVHKEDDPCSQRRWADLVVGGGNMIMKNTHDGCQDSGMIPRPGRRLLAFKQFTLQTEITTIKETPRIESSFACTAWSYSKVQVWLDNVQKLCRHILRSFPNILRELCGSTPAQMLHTPCTSFDAPAHVSRTFSGTSQDCPTHKFCKIFSDICLCTGKSCLNPRTRS